MPQRSPRPAYRFPEVLVEWRDHHHETDAGDPSKPNRLYLWRTKGWLTYKDDKIIRVCPTLNVDADQSDGYTIERASVVRIWQDKT